MVLFSRAAMHRSIYQSPELWDHVLDVSTAPRISLVFVRPYVGPVIGCVPASVEEGMSACPVSIRWSTTSF